MFEVQFKKALSLVLSFALLASLVPACLGTRVSAQEPDAIALANPGFEDALAIPGWQVLYGGGADFFETNAAEYSGNRSLALSDRDSGASKGIYGDRFGVTAGEAVQASAYVRVDEGAAELCIAYFDASGNMLETYPDTTVNVGDWSLQTVSGTVPEGAVQAAVFLYSGCGAVTTAYFDDVVLSAGGVNEDLTNPGFEDAQRIPGWDIIYGDQTNYYVTGATQHGGACSLVMNDPDTDASTYLYSDKFDVSAGETLTESAYVRVDEGAAELCIAYFDAGGNMLETYPDTTVNVGDWSLQTVSGTVPEGAVQAAAFLYSGCGAVTTAYFDDVTLLSDGGSAAPSNPETLVESDCSSLADMRNGGWEIDDGASGVYLNDNGNTLGTPASVSMKSVDAGQLLFYQDGTADNGDPECVSAFKSPDDGSYVGDASWTLTLRMKIADLMKMSAYTDPRSGFTILVNTGSLIARINLGADDKIRLLDANNNAQEAARANLRIGDGKFHTWTISGDPGGDVYVACDGVSVAGFSGNTYAYDSSNEPWNASPVQFINYRSGAYISGATEVYFDDISLARGTLTAAPAMANLDFETAPDADGTIPGWTRADGADASTVFETTEDKHGGNSSLKLVDSGAGESPWLFSNMMSVNPGDSLALSAWVNVASGVAEISLRFVDDDGNVSYIDKDLSPTDGWTQETVSATVPTGATEAGIFIWSGLSASATAYYDDIGLTDTTGENPGTGIRAGTPVDLGDMIKTGKALDLYSIVAENAETGEDEMYTVSTGSATNPSVFYVLDPATGAVKWSQPIPDVEHAYAIVQGSDHNIYFAGCEGGGVLYRYLPAEQRIEKVADNPGKAWVWDLAASNDGKIYGSTSETGSVFAYDIAAGQMTDLGTIQAGATYARGLGVTDRYLYVGVGEPDAVYKIDRTTLAKTEIETAASGDPNRMGSTVWIYNGRVFIRDNAMRLFVMDESTDQQINELSFQQAISAPSPYDSNILYYKSNNALWEYDFATNTGSEVPDSPHLSDDASNALNWFTPSSGPKAGRHLLGITDDAGGYVVYDPTDNTAAEVKLQLTPQAVDIESIEKGPDGRLYIGGYQFGAAVYDTAAKETDDTEPAIDQPEATGFLNGKAYLGTYGSARIYVYDPAKPSDYTYGASGNPGLAYDIGNDQDRPFAVTSGDNKLFVGTVPDYGELGGALTVYDAVTGKWTEYRNVVQDQSIVGLAYKNGLLYGGTSVAGGLGIDPSAAEAKIFVWDVAKGQKVKEVSVDIPGLHTSGSSKPQMIGSLSFGPDGLLWGAVDGALFAMDPTTLQVVKYQIISIMNYDQDSMWRPFFLRWGADGLLYTTVGRKLVVFNPDTMAYTILLNDYVGLAALGDDGNIYYASGSKLMELPILRTEAQNAAFEKGTAIDAAVDSIDMLPGPFEITLAGKAAVAAARALVQTAEAGGAADAEITNLQKLRDCEARIAALQNAAGGGPTSTLPVSITGTSTTNADGTVTTTATIPADDTDSSSVSAVNINLGAVSVSAPPAVLSAALDGDGTAALQITQAPTPPAVRQSAFQIAASSGGVPIASLDLDLAKIAADGTSTSVHQLSGNVTVTVALTASQLAQITDISNARLYYYDSSAGKLTDMHAAFDPKAGTVTFSTNHFSAYVIVQGSASAASCGVAYAGHVQHIGWQKDVSDAAEAGTEGRALRMEGIRIRLTGSLPAGASVVYQAHVQKCGWMAPVSDDAVAGTTGRGLRMEALRVTLRGLPGYAVKYRAYVQHYGWLNWVTTADGADISKASVAGTTGKGLRMEAIEIQIVKVS